MPFIHPLPFSVARADFCLSEELVADLFWIEDPLCCLTLHFINPSFAGKGRICAVNFLEPNVFSNDFNVAILIQAVRLSLSVDFRDCASHMR